MNSKNFWIRRFYSLRNYLEVLVCFDINMFNNKLLLNTEQLADCPLKAKTDQPMRAWS